MSIAARFLDLSFRIEWPKIAKAIVAADVGVVVPVSTPVITRGRRIAHGSFGVGKKKKKSNCYDDD